jgi:hypothetical protein
MNLSAAGLRYRQKGCTAVIATGLSRGMSRDTSSDEIAEKKFKLPAGFLSAGFQSPFLDSSPVFFKCPDAEKLRY